MGRLTGQCPLHGNWNLMIPTDTAEMCPVCWKQDYEIERLEQRNEVQRRELMECRSALSSASERIERLTAEVERLQYDLIKMRKLCVSLVAGTSDPDNERWKYSDAITWNPTTDGTE